TVAVVDDAQAVAPLVLARVRLVRNDRALPGRACERARLDPRRDADPLRRRRKRAAAVRNLHVASAGAVEAEGRAARARNSQRDAGPHLAVVAVAAGINRGGERK